MSGELKCLVEQSRMPNDHDRLNACELEIDLLCRGLRLPDDASLTGARRIARTRAGLGSGLEVIAAGKGTNLHLASEGERQEEALEALIELINNRFDEGE